MTLKTAIMPVYIEYTFPFSKIHHWNNNWSCLYPTWHSYIRAVRDLVAYLIETCSKHLSWLWYRIVGDFNNLDICDLLSYHSHRLQEVKQFWIP